MEDEVIFLALFGDFLSIELSDDENYRWLRRNILLSKVFKRRNWLQQRSPIFVVPETSFIRENISSDRIEAWGFQSLYLLWIKWLHFILGNNFAPIFKSHTNLDNGHCDSTPTNMILPTTARLELLRSSDIRPTNEHDQDNVYNFNECI